MNFSLHLTIILIAPLFVIGIINRTKALWAGRKGPRLNQYFFDILRLLRKTPVYSEVSSWIFPLAPWITLVATLAAALISPVVAEYAPICFPYDYVYFAYLLALGKVAMILGAMDTGSSFEGMGASREATYSALIEPALFFAFGTFGILSGHTSFLSFMAWAVPDSLGMLGKFFIVSLLFILVQIESSRVPVDDPNTHLELTMIHEVMILDHSGPELAAIQYGSAIKMLALMGIFTAVLNPLSAQDGIRAWAVALFFLSVIAVAIGLVESLIARFRLRAVPIYAAAGIIAGAASVVFSLVVKGGAK